MNAARAAKLDAALADIAEIGDLHPALVVSVAPMAARVYIRSMGFAQIEWDGMSWAHRRISETRVGAAPKHAEDVVQRGDVVYVVTDGTAYGRPAQLPEAQSALVALDPNDGAIAALVGGFDYFDNKFNRATQARRQPGSGFKPFLYSAALENGFTPSTIVMDAPIVYDDSGQEKIWRPENNEKSFSGPTRLREALVHSRNLVTVRVVRQLGIDTAIDYAEQVRLRRRRHAQGHDHRARQPAGNTAGDGRPPMRCSPMAAIGWTPYFIHRIEDASGQVVFQAKPTTVCDSCDAATAGARMPRTRRPPDAAAAASASGSTQPARRCRTCAAGERRGRRRRRGRPRSRTGQSAAAADRARH